MRVAAPDEEDALGEAYLVLWAGSVSERERQVQDALRQAKIRVETAEGETVAERAAARAPDLIVLDTSMSERAEAHVANVLARAPAAALVALSGSSDAAPKARSRFGLVARLDSDAEPALLATQIGELLERLSAEPASFPLKGNPEQLPALAARFASMERTGILVVENGGGIAIDSRGPIAPSVAFSEKTTSLRFEERPHGSVRVLHAPSAADASEGSLSHIRVLVVDEDETRRERLAQELLNAKAEVRTAEPELESLIARCMLDPSVIVVAAPALTKSGAAALFAEPRLASAALLVLDEEALELAGEALLGSVRDLARSERDLRQRLRNREPIAERLETLGPARWLKLLGECRYEVSLRVFSASGFVAIDFSAGQLASATLKRAGQAPIEGKPVLDALKTFFFGRVLAGPRVALAAFERANQRREVHVVGKIGSGVRPKHPFVAEEVVVQRSDGRVEPEGAKTIRRNEYVELGSEQDHDVPTGAYEPKLLEELRAKSSDLPPPLEPDDDRESVTFPWITDVPTFPRDSTPMPAPSGGFSTQIEIDDEERRASDSGLFVPPPGAFASEIYLDDSRQIRKPGPLSKRKLSNALWFAAAIVLALTVAAWAAWRLSSIVSSPTPRMTVTPESTDDSDDSVDDDLPSSPGEGTSPDPETREEDAEEQVDVPALIADALAAAQEDDYERSAELSREALAASPRNPRAAYRLAVALYQLDEFDEAATWCERAFEFDSTDPMPLLLLGDVHVQRGRFVEATRAYERALVVDPSFRPAQRRLEQQRSRRGGVTPPTEETAPPAPAAPEEGATRPVPPEEVRSADDLQPTE